MYRAWSHPWEETGPHWLKSVEITSSGSQTDCSVGHKICLQHSSIVFLLQLKFEAAKKPFAKIYQSTSQHLQTAKKPKLVQSCDAANFKRLHVFPCKVEGPTNNMFFLFCHKILAYHTLTTLTDTEVAANDAKVPRVIGPLFPCWFSHIFARDKWS